MVVYQVGDRIRVATACFAMPNLIGREGVVVELLPLDMAGPSMISVQIDDLTSVPRVPFYPNELVNITKEQK